MEKLIQKKNIHIQLWSLLGPSLILLCALVGAVRPHIAFAPCLSCALISILLITWWNKQGLIAGLSLLVITTGFSLYHSNVSDYSWILCFASAVGLSLITTSLALEESRSLVALMQQTMSKRQLNQLTDAHQLAEETWVDQRNALIKKIDATREENEVLITSSEAQLQMVREELQRLQNQPAPPPAICVMEISVEPEQSHVSELCITTVPAVEVCEGVVNENPAIQTEEAHHYRSLYQQLRAQFEEKSQILSQTRAELFRSNEQILVLQKDKAETLQLSNNPYSAALEKHIVRMNDTHSKQEKFLLEEITDLQTLVGRLLES